MRGRTLDRHGWRRSRLAVGAGAVTLALALAACGSTSRSTSSSKAAAQRKVQANITVASLPVADNAPIWLGVKDGIFSRYGLNVKYDILSGGGPADVSALESGSVQFANFSSPIFMLATEKGINMKSVVQLDYIGHKVSPEGIFVLASSPIKTLAGLKGATIGVNSTTSLEEIRMVTEVLPSLHIAASDVKFVPIPWPEEKEALLTHEVDAVVPFDPYTTELIETPGVRELSGLRRFAPASGLALGVIATLASYASAHPAIVRAFQQAMASSIDYTTSHPKQAAAVVASVLKLPLSLSLTVLGHVEFSENGAQRIRSYDNMETEMKSDGLLPSSYNVSKYILK